MPTPNFAFLILPIVSDITLASNHKICNENADNFYSRQDKIFSKPSNIIRDEKLMSISENVNMCDLLIELFFKVKYELKNFHITIV